MEPHDDTPGCVKRRVRTLATRVKGSRMELMTYFEERPGKLVQVLIDDIWHDGTLEAWREPEGHWRGYVCCSVGVGMRHLGWVDEGRLRQV